MVQEITVEDYREVEVPDHLHEKFEKMDKLYLED